MRFFTRTPPPALALASDAPPRTIWRDRFKRFAKNWIVPFALAAMVLGPFRSSIADWNDVPSGSMEPTILPGDRITVNKLAFGLRLPFTGIWLKRWSTPAPGEVVICYSPVNGDRLVKRVVAGPGDTLELRAGVLFVNGQSLAYSDVPAEQSRYIPSDRRSAHVFLWESLGPTAHAVMATPSRPNTRSFGPVTVPPGEYFVMGDNRDNSADSRVFGTIREHHIVGRVFGVALSLNPDRNYRPRFERFFKTIH